MQLGGRKGIRPVKTWGGYGDGVVSSVGVVPTWTVGASASIFILCSTKPRRSFMMAYNSDIGLDPWATPHAYVNRRWGYPAGTQHSPMLRQKAVYMRTLPGLMDCSKAGPFGLVPGMLTHLQGDQVN